MRTPKTDDRPTWIAGMAVVGALLTFGARADASELLADHDALVAARAKRTAGDDKAALALVDTIRPRSGCDLAPDVVFEEASLLAAEILAADDPKASAERLLGLPADGARFELAMTRLRAANETATATAVEVRLLIEAAESPAAAKLADALGPAGVAKRLATPEQRMARIRALLENHVNDRASAEAQTLSRELGPKHVLSCELGYVIGKSARKLRRYRAAMSTLAAARKNCAAAKQDDFALRSGLLEIQVRGIRGESVGTAKVAKWLETNFPGHSFLDDAWLIVAEVLDRRDKSAEAAKVYERIAAMKGADHATLAAWRLAFADLRTGREDKARERLAWIRAADPARSSEHSRATYWLARLTKDEGQRSALYAELTTRPNFYTWLALDRLRRESKAEGLTLEKALLAARTSVAKPFEPPKRIATSEAYRRATALLERDEPVFATAELKRLECSPLTGDEAFAVAKAYEAMGAHPDAQMVLRTNRELLHTLDPTSAEVWRAAYSRAFDAEIEEAAKKAKIEKWFFMGLVREESTFDPEIVSWAGAVGLAQLMPPTAIGAYAEVFGGRLDLAKLTEPQLNLRLGGHVLAQGYRRFGSEPLALSAYNGGPGLTSRMLPAAATDFDLWVETVTVKETRRYMKRVSETWGLYRLFYDDENPFIDLPDVVAPAKTSK